jgi:hypothetical protein
MFSQYLILRLIFNIQQQKTFSARGMGLAMPVWRARTVGENGCKDAHIKGCAGDIRRPRAGRGHPRGPRFGAPDGAQSLSIVGKWRVADHRGAAGLALPMSPHRIAR